MSAISDAKELPGWNVGGLLADALEARPADTAADRELAARILRGEEGAFEELVNRSHRQLARISGRFFRRPEIIEEITQEVFVKAFIGMSGYRAEMPIEHWLSRIAVNVCYDQLRRKKSRPEIAISQIADEPAEFFDRLRLPEKGEYWERQDVRMYAEQLLAKLSPEERVVLTLMTLEDLSVAEISKLTGWSAANVKIRAFRARRRLRKILGQSPEMEEST